MSEVIRHEIWFFFFSLLSGVILLCAYDQLRVLRRVIPHNGFFQSLEDFFFWTAAGIFCFGVSFRGNSGSIRGFFPGGSCLWHVVLSPDGQSLGDNL